MTKQRKYPGLKAVGFEKVQPADATPFDALASGLYGIKLHYQHLMRSSHKVRRTIRKNSVPVVGDVAGGRASADGYARSTYSAEQLRRSRQGAKNKRQRRDKKNAHPTNMQPQQFLVAPPHQTFTSQTPSTEYDSSAFIVLNTGQQTVSAARTECYVTLNHDPVTTGLSRPKNPIVTQPDTLVDTMNQDQADTMEAAKQGAPISSDAVDQILADEMPTSLGNATPLSEEPSACAEAFFQTSETPVNVATETGTAVPVSKGEMTKVDDAVTQDSHINHSHQLPQALLEAMASLLAHDVSLLENAKKRAQDVSVSLNKNVRAQQLLADFIALHVRLQSQWGDADIADICEVLKEPGTGGDAMQIREGRVSILKLSKLMEDIATALFEDARHHHVSESHSRNSFVALALAECFQCESDAARARQLQAEIACLIGISSSIDAFLRTDGSPDLCSDDALPDLISSSVTQGLWLDYLQKRFPLLSGNTKLIDHVQMKERWEGEVQRVFDCVQETLSVVAEKANALRDAGNQDPGIPRLLVQLATASKALRKLLHLGTSGDIGSGSPVHLGTASFRERIPRADVVSFEGISDDQSGKNSGGQSRLRAIATSLRFGSHDALQIRVHTSPIQSSDAQDDTLFGDPDTMEAPVIVCHRIGGPAALSGNVIPIEALGLPSVIGKTVERLKQEADSALVLWLDIQMRSAEETSHPALAGRDGVMVCERTEQGSLEHPHFVVSSETDLAQPPTGRKVMGSRYNGFGDIGPHLRRLGVTEEDAYVLVDLAENDDVGEQQEEASESARHYVYRIVKSDNHWDLDVVYEMLAKAGFTVGLSQSKHPDAVEASNGAMYTLPPGEVDQKFLRSDKIREALDLASDSDLEQLAQWLEEQANSGLVPKLARKKRQRILQETSAKT
ncbi:MAG: hypothetical protein KBC47_03850 [Candidatus Peribacteraceae bacterium]|nr:hypothetical protein [Candidatus Peribacteraceae bacterium]